MRTEAKRTPHVGEIWKRRGARGERYVLIRDANGAWIQVETCEADGTGEPGRCTRANARLFGMRYDYESGP